MYYIYTYLNINILLHALSMKSFCCNHNYTDINVTINILLCIINN